MILSYKNLPLIYCSLALLTGFFSACSQAEITVPAKQDSHLISKADTIGVHHLGLTVSDLDASTSFFVDSLGWTVTGGQPDYPSVFVSDDRVTVTLWRAENSAAAVPFNRKANIGLHHLALMVSDLTTLDRIHETLKTVPGVVIEFAPELMGDGPTTHMMVNEPSGNRIEFIVPGG